MQIYSNCNGINFKNLLVKLRQNYNLDPNKLVSFCTDGSRTLIGNKNGAVYLFKKYLLNLNKKK